MAMRWLFDRNLFTVSRQPLAAHPTRRRDALVWLGGIVAWTGSAYSRQTVLPVVGYLGLESPERNVSRLAAFREGLAQMGYREGQNVALEFRWTEGQYDRLLEFARDLVARQVTVLAAPGGAPVALAAKSATATIPIVFEMGGDPVVLGVVDNLARPGGNITGVSSLSVEVSGKRLEFLRDVVPNAVAFTVIVNPTSPTAHSQVQSLHRAADTLGVQLQVSTVSREQDFEPVYASVAGGRTGGLVFTSDPYFAHRSGYLAELSLRHAVPAVTQSRDFVSAGGLISYGGDFTQSHFQAGHYTGRILRGEKPSDLPVHLVTKVELFVNLRTAGALGLTIPASLLSGADTVIE